MTVCKHMKLGLSEMLCKARPKLIYLPVEYVLSVVPRLWDHLTCFWRCCLPGHLPSLKRICFALFYLVLFQLAAAECLMFNHEGISLPNTLLEKEENTLKSKMPANAGLFLSLFPFYPSVKSSSKYFCCIFLHMGR